MRMVEMRKGGLKGKAMCISSSKGLERSDLKGSKGKRGSVGRSQKALEVIPEVSADEEGFLEGGGGEVAEGVGGKEGAAGGAELVMEDLGETKLGGLIDSLTPAEEVLGVSVVVEEGLNLVRNDSMVVMADMDSVLDLCEAQPLQNMTFLLPKESSEARNLLKGSEVGEGSGIWAKVREVNLQDGPVVEMFSNEEFPPLNKDTLRIKNGSPKNKEVPPLLELKGKGELRTEVSGRSRLSSYVQRGNRSSAE